MYTIRMKRKIVKQGQGAYTITLPVTWIRKKGLKSGNEIDILEQAGGLFLSAEGLPEQESRVSVSSSDKTFLRTFLASYYRRGCKQLVVEFKKEIPLKTLQNISETLYGFEIASFDGKVCVFDQLQSSDNSSVDSLIGKTFYYTLRSLDMIINKTPYDAEEFDALRKTLLKIRDHTLQKIVRSNAAESYELYAMAVFLEKISSRPFKFYRAIQRILTEKEIDLVRQIKDQVEFARKCFRKKDFGMVQEFYREMETAKRDRSILSKYDPQVGFFYLDLAHMLFTIASRLSNICATMQLESKK